MRISRFAARAVASFIGVSLVSLGLSTPAQAQDPNSSAAKNVAVRTNSLSGAIGGFNGDGRSDLVVPINGGKTGLARQAGTEAPPEVHHARI
jgi:hypothetical protein